MIDKFKYFVKMPKLAGYLSHISISESDVFGINDWGGVHIILQSLYT